jgi:hypothetical protein
MDCLIGPKTRIHDGCYLGAGNKIFAETLAEGTQLANYEWAFGKPQASGPQGEAEGA